MDQIVQTGRTVEEAEEQALAALGVDRSEVEVEILNRGRQGFLGIGGELAEVRVTRIGTAPSPTPEHAEPGPDEDQTDEPDLADEPAADELAADDRPAPVLTVTADTPAGTAVQAIQRILSAVGADVDVTMFPEPFQGHIEIVGQAHPEHLHLPRGYHVSLHPSVP